MKTHDLQCRLCQLQTVSPTGASSRYSANYNHFLFHFRWRKLSSHLSFCFGVLISEVTLMLWCSNPPFPGVIPSQLTWWVSTQGNNRIVVFWWKRWTMSVFQSFVTWACTVCAGRAMLRWWCCHVNGPSPIKSSESSSWRKMKLNRQTKYFLCPFCMNAGWEVNSDAGRFGDWEPLSSPLSLPAEWAPLGLLGYSAIWRQPVSGDPIWATGGGKQRGVRTWEAGSFGIWIKCFTTRWKLDLQTVNSLKTQDTKSFLLLHLLHQQFMYNNLLTHIYFVLKRCLPYTCLYFKQRNWYQHAINWPSGVLNLKPQQVTTPVMLSNLI